jgi:hypothetical protein
LKGLVPPKSYYPGTHSQYNSCTHEVPATPVIRNWLLEGGTISHHHALFSCCGEGHKQRCPYRAPPSILVVARGKEVVPSPGGRPAVALLDDCRAV